MEFLKPTCYITAAPSYMLQLLYHAPHEFQTKKKNNNNKEAITIYDITLISYGILVWEKFLY